MTKHYDTIPPYILADNDKVLCDGETMTGLGGRISSNDIAYLDTVQEMTEAEALALIEGNGEATEADYIEALNELGVDLNEEV